MESKEAAKKDEAFKGVDAFTKFFAEGYWDKTSNVIFDLAHGWKHWLANIWGLMANEGQMKYTESRQAFENGLGRFLDRDGNSVTPWMVNKARGKLVQEWARNVIKVPLGWESITDFFEKPFQGKIAEILAHAGNLGTTQLPHVTVMVTIGHHNSNHSVLICFVIELTFEHLYLQVLN